MNNPIKDVKFSREAKTPLVKGINTVCDAVASTMGYRGRIVLIESAGGKPEPTKDGVSVAKAIFLDDAVESIGAEFIKQACQKTVDEAGDGTTTTAVLAQRLINDSEGFIAKGISPIDIKNQLETDKDRIVAYIKSKSIPVEEKFLYDVARISANNDEELGKVISEAFIKAGKNGVVSYETSDNSDTYVDFIDGMPIARGWEFEGFVNVPERRAIEFNNNPYILLSNRKIEAIREIIPFLELAHTENKELFIISEMEYDVMKTLYVNKKQGLKVAVIQPPSIGEKRRDYLSDIKLATGGLVLDLDTNTNIDSYDPKEILGTCSKLMVSKEDTVLFFNVKPNPEEITAKITELDEVVKNSSNKLEIEYMKDRIAKLACGVSVVKVGGNTEGETMEKIDRVDDAIHAVRAAIAEGVVIGGGMTLLKAITDLDLEDRYIASALFAPFETIMANAGANPESILGNIDAEGYDVKEYQFVYDMVEAGIIDPAKVVRCALENAVSVASVVLMTNATITYKRQE